MNRRGLLGSVGRLLVVGGVTAGAGCTDAASPTGPLTPPRAPEETDTSGASLVVRDFVDVEGEEGNLLVRVTVENRSGDRQTGTIVVTATAGDTEETVSEDVTVPGGERVDVTVATSLSFEAFSQSGSLRVNVQY
ncbi:hypothetical protein [Halobaculum limi]|uniref:hypothetical protein n=1 Tax=Halobaculum limi TaxID=3031916 RepID=UPI0024075D86|nr:hypothetical protein [Halobaculum sp. YSMS11]